MIKRLKAAHETLKKLVMVYRSDRKEQLKEDKVMFKKIEALCGSEQAIKKQKDLRVPKHLCCPISGELMTDPVTV